MRHSDMDARLQEIYDQIPDIPDCQGLCWISCGPAPMTVRERQRIRELGVRITPVRQAVAQEGDYFCEALTNEHTCSVYEARPLVCRLWGTIDRLKCPYGCVPRGGWLNDSEARELIKAVDEIGGRDGSMPQDWARAYSPAVIKILYAMTVKDGQNGEQRRIQRATIPAGFRKPQEGKS